LSSLSAARLGLVAAVAALGLVFTGAAQAAAPPDPNEVGFTTLSNIQLNGVQTTRAVVAPGADVKISANWSDSDPCHSCILFAAVGFAGHTQAGCIEGPTFSPSSGSGEVDLGPAPTKPGAYNVVAQHEPVFFCGQFWNAEESTKYDVVAQIIIQPTSTEQCKKGGWEGFAEEFKNQGDCVSFVATGGKNPPGV
jgi:hypothetical protein